MLDSRRAEACSANLKGAPLRQAALHPAASPHRGHRQRGAAAALSHHPQGMVFYRGTVEALADRYVVFRDDYGAVSRLLLELIRAEALARGYHIITCPVPYTLKIRSTTSSSRPCGWLF